MKFYIYFLLLLFSPLFLFGGITCTPNDDGTWTCWGDGGTTGGDDDDDDDNTNGTYTCSCTNCVQITPAECELVKASIIASCDSMSNYASQVVAFADKVTELQSTIISLRTSVSDLSLYNLANSNILNYVQDKCNNLGICSYSGDGTFDDHSSYLSGCLAGLSSYISSLSSKFAVLDFTAPSIYSDISEVSTLASGITCTACSDGVSSGGSSSTGSSSTGSSSTTSYTSVGCADCLISRLDAIKKVLDNQYSTLSSLAYSITNGIYKSSWWGNGIYFANGFQTADINSTFSDYLFGYLETYRKIVKPFYNAENFKLLSTADTSNDKFDLVNYSKQIFNDAVGGTIDVSKYSDLSWASRVEVLLARIAGVGASNDLDHVSEDAASSLKEGIDSQLDQFNTAAAKYNRGFVTRFTEQFKNISRILSNPYKSGSYSREIQLITPSHWFGNEGLTITVDYQIVHYSNVCFNLLWCALFFVGGFKLMMYLCKIVVASVSRFVKLISTLFD